MKLSVIVPSYNVSNYLEECIDSIIAQQIESMEVIIINDGSTDNTLEIAKRMELKYRQVIVIDQKNGGLGNARNNGALHASGDFITFVDSDDVLTQGAYKLMLETVEKSGSDFVIGNVVRFNSTRTYPSVLHKNVFYEDLIGVSIKEHHELIYDTTAWNKIFRMDFWKKYNFKFPEKMLYEDIPVTIPAHAMANKVDVLTKVVYKWRARDAGDSSITQQKEKMENFVDRVRGIDMVRNFFQKHNVSQELQNVYDFKNLNMDFPLYLSYMLDVGNDYQNAVNSYVKKYIEEVNQQIFMELPVLLRIKYRLIEQGRFDDFLQVLRDDRAKKNILKPKKTREGYIFPYRYLNILPHQEKIANIEFNPIHQTEIMRWRKEGLFIEGIAYLNKLSFSRKRSAKFSVSIVSGDCSEKIDITKHFVRKLRMDVTLKRGVDTGSKIAFKRLYNYNYSGFTLLIPNNILNELKNEQTYKIEITIRHNTIEKSFYLGSPQKGFRTKPNYQIFKNFMIVPKYNTAWEFSLQKLSLKNSINNLAFSNTGIILTGNIENEKLQLKMINEQDNDEIYLLETVVEKNKFKSNITLDILENIFKDFNELGFIDKNFYFTFDDDNKLIRSEKPVFEIYGYDAEKQVTVVATQNGDYRLRFGKVLPIVQSLKDENKKFVFEFIVPKPFLSDAIAYSVLLKGKNEEHNLPYKLIEENEYIIKFSCSINHAVYNNDKIFSILLKKKLDHEIEILDSSIDDSTNTASIEIYAEELFENYDNYKGHKTRLTDEYITPIYLFNFGIDKLQTKSDGIKYEIYHPFGKYQLQFRISAYWEKIDDGPRRQEVVRRILYPIWRLMPLKNNVCILESFWGREFSDNPKAVYDYLVKQRPDMKFIIPLQDTLQKSDIEIEKTNTEIVKLNSWRYLYFLARGKYFINNVNFPDYYKKRKAAIEIQTMHGTPLKKLGLDNPGEIPEHQIEQFIQKCKRWDYLTIPSDYVGEIAKSAYRFEGDFLKIGYPRNDSLFNNSEKIKRSLIEKYELPKNRKIILYAPTWRVKGKFSMPIDLQKLREKFGEEYIVIIKLHHYMIPNFDLDGLEDFAFLFDRGSIISDFYKIADILITDYSSVMFDYAILKKPMLFFTYDYDNYKNELRGMYFDFKQDAPGPLVETTDELIGEIETIDSYFEKYSDKIEMFTEKFIQYDTGNASKSLVERVIDKK